MKKALLILLLLVGYGLNAQTEGVQLPEAGKEGDFGDWQKVTDKLPDGTDVTYEYRVRLAKKNAFACNYDVEVKNTSTVKFAAVISFSYQDRLVNGTFGGEEKIKVKPGDSSTARLLVQGCKRKKDEPKDMNDYAICRSCGISYNLKLIK